MTKFKVIQAILSIRDPKKQITDTDGKIVFGYQYRLIGCANDGVCEVVMREDKRHGDNSILAYAKCVNPIEALQKLSKNLICPSEQNKEDNSKLLLPENCFHNCDLKTCSLEEWTLHGYGFIAYRYDEHTIIFRAETGELFSTIHFVGGKCYRVERKGESETFEKALKIAFPKRL